MKHREIYHQTNLPIFQNRMYGSAKEAQNCPTGTMKLVEDQATGLLYNEAFDANLLDYDSFYQNEQSYSNTFKKHMERIADIIENKIGSKKLIEIGCGKGTFLELMLSRGAEIIGFDPAYQGSNQLIKREYFSGSLETKGEGIILRHVLEHIPDPVGFLDSIANANGGKGLIYIEVPCFDWIVNSKAWFDIFYEHVNYFRLVDFFRIFKKIIYSGRSFEGQYLSIVADLSSLTKPKRNFRQTIDFSTDFEEIEKLANNSDPTQKIIVWGAASKGVIFSLLLKRKGVSVDRIIDISPEKQGLYIPGTGLRVMSPSEGLQGLPKGSKIYVMNPNYLEEIRSMVGEKYSCKGPNDD